MLTGSNSNRVSKRKIISNFEIVPKLSFYQISIGLVTALAGVIELDLVVPGKYTILTMGPLTIDICITIAATILIAAAMHFKVKGSFMYGLIFGTLSYWILTNEWPDSISK